MLVSCFVAVGGCVGREGVVLVMCVAVPAMGTAVSAVGKHVSGMRELTCHMS